MKKLFAFIVIGALAACLAMAGCAQNGGSTQGGQGAQDPGKTDAPPVVEQPDSAMTGGWTVNTEFLSKSVPADLQAVFNNAASEVLDVSYDPVAVLGSQVVAGMNYAFLSQTIYWEGDATPIWTVVTVYNDLEGNATVTNDKTIDVADVKTTDEAPGANLSGGWTVPDPSNGMVVPDDAQAAFDSAMSTYNGTSASPIALLGTQIVAGVNYRFLAMGAAAGAEPANTLYVVDVYTDPDGVSLVTSMKPFDLLYYVTPRNGQ